MSCSTIESVCVFGSAARSSTDSLSDRDVLIIANTAERQRNLATEWRQNGWSTAVYSPGRVERMIEAGSLFVQHIKLEGIIMKDRSGWLSEKLSRASPKRSYMQDALESVFLALPMERFRGDEQIENCPIVADLGYTAVRNFGICYFADRADMLFDYQEIIDRLREEFHLEDTELRLLQSLRSGKVSYRAGTSANHLSGTVGELRMVLSKFFNNRPLGEIPECVPIRRLSGAYTMLRDLEASVMSKFSRSCGGVVAAEKVLPRVWKYVQNPRAYSWEIRNVGQFEMESNRLVMLDKWSRLTQRDERVIGLLGEPAELRNPPL